ncbi:MAG: aromatic aminobenezylarsenical efflux permease ArsG family transporter [Rikenellaceae bacterium]
MEWLQLLLDSSTTPIFTAFLLGLLTAVSPCPLATNITAIGFISRDLESRHRIFWSGLLYTLGRVIAYTVLGVILITILREGSSLFHVQKMISKYGEMLLSPALVLIGLFMLFGDRLNLPSFGFSGSGSDNLKSRGGFGALLLGVLFALAFCPTSGVFYFGMLIPMSATATGGYLMPVIFAVATSLPVIIVAWVLAYSVGEVGKVYNRIKVFQRWFSLVVALLFIAVGVILWSNVLFVNL